MKKETAFYYLPRILIVAVFIGTTVFFYGQTSPEEVIARIGIHNSYLIMFILAALGGRLAFSAIPYHVVLMTLAVGGLNPLLLGLAAALGVTLGDTASYFVGYQGSVLIPKKTQNSLRWIYNFGIKHPKILPPILFLYAASPISNDFIAISMGLSRYPFWHMIIPLGLGNFMLNASLALLSTQTFAFFQGTSF